MDRYTAQELAETLQIDNTQVGLWAKQFSVPREREGNKWFYPEEARTILATIKALKNQDCGMDTITRRIATENTSSAETTFHFRTDHLASGHQLSIFDLLSQI